MSNAGYMRLTKTVKSSTGYLVGSSLKSVVWSGNFRLNFQEGECTEVHFPLFSIVIVHFSANIKRTKLILWHIAIGASKCSVALSCMPANNLLFEFTGKKINLFMFSVGNKNDCPDRKVVLYEDAKRFADQMNISLFETSAKDNINVEEVSLRSQESRKAKQLLVFSCGK